MADRPKKLSKRNAWIIFLALVAVVLAPFGYKQWVAYRERNPIDVFDLNKRLSSSLQMLQVSVRKHIEETNRSPLSSDDLDLSPQLPSQGKLISGLEFDPDGPITVTFTSRFWAPLPSEVRGKKVVLEPHVFRDDQGVIEKIRFHCQTIDMPTRYLRRCRTETFPETLAAEKAQRLAQEKQDRERAEEESRRLRKKEREENESIARRFERKIRALGVARI